MCKFFSCIIDRKLKVHYDGNNNSHEDVIKQSNLKDDKLIDRDFVRLEITPKKLTLNKEDWNFEVDEKGTLPDWYKDNEIKIKEIYFKELFNYLKKFPIEKSIKFIDSLKDINWYKPDNKPKKEWKLFKGKDWGAARDAALMNDVILLKDKLAKKHIDHAKARWEVWQKGYGLLCDVNGILYVYVKETK